MPARLLRDWTDSDRLNALKPETERFFIRLIMKADDYGLYTANTRLLRASLFPLLLTEVTDADITRWLAQCQQAGIVRLYQAQGKQYIQIINFGQRLRKARAKHPIPEDYAQYAATGSQPTANDGDLTATCGDLHATCGQLPAIGGQLHATRGESPPTGGNTPPEVEVEYEAEVETEHSPLSPSGESAPPSTAAPLNVTNRTSLSPPPYTEAAGVSPHSVAPAAQAPPLNVTSNTSLSPSPGGEGLGVRQSHAPYAQAPPLNLTGNTSQSPSPGGEGLGVRPSPSPHVEGFGARPSTSPPANHRPQTGYTGVLSPPNLPFPNMYHNLGNHALFRPKTEDEVFKAWALLIPSLPTTALERRKALGDFIRQYRPVFIEPYATLWNLFALDNGLNQLHHLTERRRQKLSIRAREGSFDFVALLIQVKKSPFALGDNPRGWKIDFDYLLESETNYIKILEGKFEG